MNHLQPFAADPTLLDCLRCYFEHKPLKLRTKSQYEAVVRRCFPDWLYRNMNAISRREVEERHKELTLAGAYQANFAARVLRALYIFAAALLGKTQHDNIIETGINSALLLEAAETVAKSILTGGLKHDAA